MTHQLRLWLEKASSSRSGSSDQFKSVAVSSLRFLVSFFSDTVLQRAQTPPRPKCQSKVIRDYNADFRIDDRYPNVYQIAAKMLWIHCLVGVSRLAKFRKNRPVTCCRNGKRCPKIPYSAMVKKWKSDPEYTCKSGSTSKVNHFERVIVCPCLPCLVDVRFRVRDCCPALIMTDTQKRSHYPPASA